MNNFHVIIPARLASVRLPGKVLLEIAGKPLIQHVYERAVLCGAESITIAVDDERVKSVAEGFGAKVCMTAIEHMTGSDRLSEVVQKLQIPDEDIVVNVQGDEPHLTISAIQSVVQAMTAFPSAGMTTLCTKMHHPDEVMDPNVVKVVFDKNGFALYFSRSPIPCDRDQIDVTSQDYFRHIGLYAYRAKTLKQYGAWKQPGIEQIEKLEQLRALWNGIKIHVTLVEEALPKGIDTEADLIRFRTLLERSC